MHKWIETLGHEYLVVLRDTWYGEDMVFNCGTLQAWGYNDRIEEVVVFAGLLKDMQSEIKDRICSTN